MEGAFLEIGAPFSFGWSALFFRTEGRCLLDGACLMVTVAVARPWADASYRTRKSVSSQLLLLGQQLNILLGLGQKLIRGSRPLDIVSFPSAVGLLFDFGVMPSRRLLRITVCPKPSNTFL